MTNTDSDPTVEPSELNQRLSRRGLLARGAVLGGAAAALPLWATEVAQAASATRAAAKPLLVWASHFFYGQPVALGVVVGFRDFTDMAGWDFRFIAPPGQGDIQATIAVQQQALALHPTAIVATMIDPRAFNSNFQKIMKAGITLELNNTQPITGNPFGLPYVGQNFVASAISSTEYMLDAVVARGKKSGVILLGGCCGLAGAVGWRIEGMKQGIAQYNHQHGTTFTYDAFQDQSDVDLTQSLPIWKAKIREHGKQFVGTNQTLVGTACVEALQALKYKPGDIPVVIFDTTTQREQLIQQGWVLAVVDQQPYIQGYVAAAQAWMMVNRYSQPPAVYDSGSFLITKTNVANILKRDTLIAQLASKYGYKV